MVAENNVILEINDSAKPNAEKNHEKARVHTFISVSSKVA